MWIYKYHNLLYSLQGEDQAGSSKYDHMIRTGKNINHLNSYYWHFVKKIFAINSILWGKNYQSALEVKGYDYENPTLLIVLR